MQKKVILPVEVVKDIAQNLVCGNKSWYHIPTRDVLWIPDVDERSLQDDIWKKVQNEINEKAPECIAFETLKSHESFCIMESFAETQVGDRIFRANLITALANKKPFAHFNAIIHNSNYRQAWFDFKNQWYIDYIREEVERYNRNQGYSEDEE